MAGRITNAQIAGCQNNTLIESHRLVIQFRQLFPKPKPHHFIGCCLVIEEVAEGSQAWAKLMTGELPSRNLQNDLGWRLGDTVAT